MALRNPVRHHDLPVRISGLDFPQRRKYTLPERVFYQTTLPGPQPELDPQISPAAGLRFTYTENLRIADDYGPVLGAHPPSYPLDHLCYLLLIHSRGDLDIGVRPDLPSAIPGNQPDRAVRDVHPLPVDVDQLGEPEPETLDPSHLTRYLDRIAYVERVGEDQCETDYDVLNQALRPETDGESHYGSAREVRSERDADLLNDQTDSGKVDDERERAYPEAGDGDHAWRGRSQPALSHPWPGSPRCHDPFAQPAKRPHQDVRQHCYTDNDSDARDPGQRRESGHFVYHEFHAFPDSDAVAVQRIQRYRSNAMMHELLRDYPVVISIPVQWGEMDAYGHVNNTVVFRYFESARIEYLERCGFAESWEQRRIGAILHSTDCRFRRPLFYPDTVLVGARALDVGTDRFTMGYRVISKAHNAVAAEGSGVIVSYDYAAGAKTAIPDDVRRGIEETERQARRVS